MTLIATGIRRSSSSEHSLWMVGRSAKSLSLPSMVSSSSLYVSQKLPNVPPRPGISQASIRLFLFSSSTSFWNAGSSTFPTLALARYTCATQPDPTGSLLSNTNICLQPFPNAICRHCLVWDHGWGFTRTWSLENRSQKSCEKMSRLVLAHWPSFMNVGPEVSVTQSSASNQCEAQRWESTVRGYKSRRGLNFRRSTNARSPRCKMNTNLWTCTRATDFLSKILCWHTTSGAEAYAMLPTVQQKSPTLGTLYRWALLTKNVLLAGSRIDTDTLWTVHLMFCKRCFVQNADILTLNNCTVQNILCLQFILVMFYSVPFFQTHTE